MIRVVIQITETPGEKLSFDAASESNGATPREIGGVDRVMEAIMEIVGAAGGEGKYVKRKIKCTCGDEFVSNDCKIHGIER